MLHFNDTDRPSVSLNELEEFITRIYNENISKRNNETLHLNIVK